MGTKEVSLGPEILLQIQDSIQCYKDFFSTETTVTFVCFLKGVDQGYTSLANKADKDAQKAIYEASGAIVIDNSKKPIDETKLA